MGKPHPKARCWWSQLIHLTASAPPASAATFRFFFFLCCEGAAACVVPLCAAGRHRIRSQEFQS